MRYTRCANILFDIFFYNHTTCDNVRIPNLCEKCLTHKMRCEASIHGSAEISETRAVELCASPIWISRVSNGTSDASGADHIRGVPLLPRSLR